MIGYYEGRKSNASIEDIELFCDALVALAFVALTARIATARERSKTAKTHLAINISGPVIGDQYDDLLPLR